MSKRVSRKKTSSLALMERESQLAGRVENALIIDIDLVLDIPLRNEADIA